MNKTKIYICGAEEASDKGNFVDIEKLNARLKTLKYTIIAPAEMPFNQMNWADKLQNRIELIKKSNAMYVLPNWKEDVMARIELTMAMDMKLLTFFHPISNKEIKDLLTTLDG
jgi:hypothetical protein